MHRSLGNTKNQCWKACHSPGDIRVWPHALSLAYLDFSPAVRSVNTRSPGPIGSLRKPGPNLRCPWAGLRPCRRPRRCGPPGPVGRPAQRRVLRSTQAVLHRRLPTAMFEHQGEQRNASESILSCKAGFFAKAGHYCRNSRRRARSQLLSSLQLAGHASRKRLIQTKRSSRILTRCGQKSSKRCSCGPCNSRNCAAGSAVQESERAMP